MIEYKFPEEKEFLLYYAEKSKNHAVLEVLSNGYAKDKTQAVELARFFWWLTDEVVKDIDNGVQVLGLDDLQAWNEYVFETIRSYLRNNGYEKEWDDQA